MDIELFSGGKLTRMLRNGIQEVLENISNQETPAKARRQLTVKITFWPEKNRKNIKVQIETKINKAPIRTEKMSMFLGTGLDGKPQFYEAGEQIPGQLHISQTEGR